MFNELLFCICVYYKKNIVPFQIICTDLDEAEILKEMLRHDNIKSKITMEEKIIYLTLDMENAMETLSEHLNTDISLDKAYQKV